eukprot:SAG11_NODE_22686_length_401_cov_4.903974_1_plen_76_part_01
MNRHKIIIIIFFKKDSKCHRMNIRYGAATMAALATATEGDSALGGEIYGSVPARRGFEAANAALNVFNSLPTGVNV